MSDIYKIGIGISITGPIERQLGGIIGMFKTADQAALSLQRTLSNMHLGNSLYSSISKAKGEIRTLVPETAKVAGAMTADMAKAMGVVKADAGTVKAAIAGWAAEVGTVEARIKALGGMMGTVSGRFGGVAPGVTAAATGAALGHRAGSRGGRGGVVGQVLDMAAMGGLPLPSHHNLVKHTLREAGTLQSEIIRMQMAGRTEYIAEALKASEAASRSVPTSDIAGNMARISEMAPVFGSVPHAIEFLPQMAKLGGLMKAVNPKAADPAYDLAKALELQGVKTTTEGGREEFTRLLSGFTKASIVTGGKVGANDFLQAIKYTRGMGRTLSEDFLTNYMPSLIQEIGGAQLGTVLKGFQRAIVGGRMTPGALSAMDDLDLVIEGKNGKPDEIKGAMAAARNPLIWTEQFLMPALKAKGITSQEGITKALMPIFSKETAFQFGNILAQDSARLHKDADQYKGAMGLDEAYKTLVGKDYATNVKALAASVESLQQVAGAPAMPQAIGGMQSLAGTLRRLTGVITGNGGEDDIGISPALLGAGAMGLFGATTLALTKAAGRRALGGAAMGYMLGGPTGAIAGAVGGGGWSLAGGAGAVGTVPLAVMMMPPMAMGTMFGKQGIEALYGANGMGTAATGRQLIDANLAKAGAEAGAALTSLTPALDAVKSGAAAIPGAANPAASSLNGLGSSILNLLNQLGKAAQSQDGSISPIKHVQPAGPPPKHEQWVVNHHHVYIGGTKVAHEVSRQMAQAARHPTSVGGYDSYGHPRYPGMTVTDAA